MTVATLRAFNRSYTQRIGVLAESYLDTGRALGPSRLLFEIGADGARVGDLRRRLGLDSGYLSRLLRQLEHEGLVTVSVDPADGRQRLVLLSAAGRREWRRLDRRSEDVARHLVDPLSPRHRAELATALTTAERLLRAATVAVDIVDPAFAGAQVALGRYFDELDDRFPDGFDPAAAGADDVAAMAPPHGAFVLLRSDETIVGCGGVHRLDDGIGEIKRMWIDPAWRGLGLGPRLLTELEAVAADLGRRRVVLDTNETLTEAIAMYERAGYDPIGRYNDNPYAHRWFAKDLSPDQGLGCGPPRRWVWFPRSARRPRRVPTSQHPTRERRHEPAVTGHASDHRPRRAQGRRPVRAAGDAQGRRSETHRLMVDCRATAATPSTWAGRCRATPTSCSAPPGTIMRRSRLRILGPFGPSTVGNSSTATTARAP